jgi:hypothetical protein
MTTFAEAARWGLYRAPDDEERLERRVEVMMDSLDRRLMSHTITQEDYDAAVRWIDHWATGAAP